MERSNIIYKYPTDNECGKVDSTDSAPLMTNVVHDQTSHQQELGFVRHTSDLEKTDVSQHDVAVTCGDVSTRMTDMQVSEPSSVPQQTSQSPSVGLTIWNSAPTTYYACQVPRAVSLTGAFVLSCFVYWCLGGLLIGGIAYVLAVIGQDHLTEGDLQKAVQLRNASYAVSVFGIIFGISFIVVFVCYYHGHIP